VVRVGAGRRARYDRLELRPERRRGHSRGLGLLIYNVFSDLC
jgi:hypothetical protein